jgi:hypothetical protein
MKHAITTLKTQLETLVINERIHRNEGRDGEADNEAAWIAEIKEALAVLTDHMPVTVTTLTRKIFHRINPVTNEEEFLTEGGDGKTYSTAEEAVANHREAAEPGEWWTAPVLLTEVIEGLPPTRMKVIGNTTYTSTVQVRNGVYRWSCNTGTTYPSLAEALRGEPFAEDLAETP